jgi:ferritin-like metal-binding protein YciE
MDYKRAYEELRDVYLKDKQVADELVEMNEKLKQNLLAEEEEHNETMKKHDELVELVMDYFKKMEAWDNEGILTLPKRAFEYSLAEAALRKAVGKD